MQMDSPIPTMPICPATPEERAAVEGVVALGHAIRRFVRRAEVMELVADVDECVFAAANRDRRKAYLALARLRDLAMEGT